MPLEFQLSSSLPPSELNFSLSAATLKQFKSVHVEAQTRLQVYAHYRPLPNKSPAVTSTASERDLDLSAIASGKEAEAVTVRERLSITCRLVKDFQQEIQLLARRHAPQLSLLVEGNLNTAGANKYSSSAGILYVVRETPPALPANESGNGGGSSILGADATFGPDGGGIPVGGGSAGGVEVDGQPSRLVTVRNLRPGRRVVIAVVNVSMYFSVTPVANSSSESGVGCSNCDGAITAACTDAGNSGGDGRCNVGFRGWGQGVGMGAVADGIELFDVPAGESLTLSVTPRLDKLRSGKGLALLANEQSLEEHFMVYNRRHPTEQYRISLKLTAGDLRTFFLSPGSKNAHAFWTLEEKITVFLKAYQCMWMDFLELEPQLKAMLGEVGRGGSAFKESGPLVFHRALDGLDAAMIAAGEPRKKSSRNIASKSFAGASTDERSTSQSGRVSDRGVGDGCRDVPGRLSPGGARSLAALTAVAQHSSRLIFEMFYITDELLFYALKHEGHVGEFALRLANLVYSVVFRHEVFAAFAALPVEERDTEGAPAFLRRWGAHLNHFLGYFPVPHAKPAILPLVELRRSLAPCFAALPAGGKGREREGAPTRDETPGVSTP